MSGPPPQLPPYEEDFEKRSQRHSERLKRILEAVCLFITLGFDTDIRGQIQRLNAVTRPFIIVYVSRPESIFIPQGSAKIFISPSLEEAVPNALDIIKQIHERVKQWQRGNATTQKSTANLNKSVQETRKEKERVEAALAAQDRRVEELEREIAVLRRSQSHGIN